MDASGASDAAASITAASQGQPVAAAITVATPLDTTLTANGRASLASIDGSGKARAKAGVALAGDQDAPEPQSAKDGTSAPSASSAKNDKAGTDSASPSPNNNAGDAQTASSGATPQPATDSAPAGQAQIGTSAPAVPDRPATPAAALAGSTDTAGSSGTQAGSATAKSSTDGVPNFGLSPANAATPTQLAATSGTVPTTAVPVAGLAVAIAARAKAGSNQFDIRLDPPELGRIDVRLDVASNGQVTSHVTVDRADTLQLLQSQQSQLERALEQAGLRTADNGLQFTLRDQSFTGQNNNNGGAPAPAAQLIVPAADLPPIQSTQIYSRYGLGSGLDIRV